MFFASPPPPDWHWLASAAWVRQQYAAPQWTLKTSKGTGDTLRIACFAGRVKKATYALKADKLVAVTFHYPADYSYQADWLVSGAESAGAHEWLDRAAKARIVARREGAHGVAYEVRYAP